MKKRSFFDRLSGSVPVDGRRIAPSGTGSFVDVSLIPVSAIQRVEILFVLRLHGADLLEPAFDRR